MKRKKYTGERLETHEQGEGMIEHLHRYAIAMESCSGKVVLDIASGEGYGSNLLATTASKVTGVDIDPATVQAANEKYAIRRKNLEFLQGSADKIPVGSGQFDIVVSFETIEHHDKHREMMAEIKRVLKPGGLLIISSPDKLFYSDKPGTKNPFHVKELYKEEFRSLLADHFKNVVLYRQKTFFSSVITPDEDHSTSSEVRFYQGNYSTISADSGIESVYLVALASDSSINGAGTSLFKDYDFIRNMRERMESTTRFQAGNLLLNPIQFFKQKFGKKKKTRQ
jgi:2-polyprenyl-3-methyl-5-hydroxy-6-metoxy-1,4-benzoquinol methylase